MSFGDYIAIALKNLKRRKARTFLTITAITVGSLSLIIMASLIISIKESLTEQFQQLGAFNLVTVVKDPNSVNANSLLSSNGDPTEGKNMDDNTVAMMRQIDHVQEATPIINGMSIGTMKLEGQDKKTWASLVGYDPSNDVFNLTVSSGRKLQADDMDKIVIGNRFVQDMGYSTHPQDLIGQNILLSYKAGGNMAPDWGALPDKPPLDASEEWFKEREKSGIDIPVEIVGITNSSAIDDGQSYLNLKFARKLMVMVSWRNDNNCSEKDKMDNQCQTTNTWRIDKQDSFLQSGYSSIVLRIDDPANIEAVTAEISRLGYGANTAKKMLDQINQILLLISVILAVVGGISLFVATIGIINTMVMATYERTREIGVMRACGATRATIRHLFMVEAGLLGFFGGLVGLLISLGLGQLAKWATIKWGANLGSIPINHIGNFPWWLIAAVIAFTTVIGIISGVGPAIKAARLNPVEALRYE